jgi:hypothetical protein
MSSAPWLVATTTAFRPVRSKRAGFGSSGWYPSPCANRRINRVAGPTRSSTHPPSMPREVPSTLNRPLPGEHCGQGCSWSRVSRAQSAFGWAPSQNKSSAGVSPRASSQTVGGCTVPATWRQGARRHVRVELSRVDGIAPRSTRAVEPLPTDCQIGELGVAQFVYKVNSWFGRTGLAVSASEDLRRRAQKPTHRGFGDALALRPTQLYRRTSTRRNARDGGSSRANHRRQ